MRRERERAPESKSLRPTPDLFNVPLGHAVPPARTCGAVWSPMGVLWMWTSPGQGSKLHSGRGAKNITWRERAKVGDKPEDSGESAGEGEAASNGAGGAKGFRNHARPRPVLTPSADAVKLQPRQGGAPGTPARRLAKERALCAHAHQESLPSLQDPAHAPPLPAEHGAVRERLDRIDSNSEGTGGAGASSVGDLDLAEVFAQVTPEVAPLDLGLAQVLKIKCAYKEFPFVCKHNSSVAQQAGRPDVAQSWIVAAHTDVRARGVDTWSMQPLGRRLLRTLIEHHASHEDFQTVASLIAVFVSAFGSATLLGAKWHEPVRNAALPRSVSPPQADAAAAVDMHVDTWGQGHRRAPDVSQGSYGGLRDEGDAGRYSRYSRYKGEPGGYRDMLDAPEVDAWSAWGVGDRGSDWARGGGREAHDTRTETPGLVEEGTERGLREIERIVRALLGDEPLHSDGEMAPARAGLLSPTEWVSWAVTHYMEVSALLQLP